MTPTHTRTRRVRSTAWSGALVAALCLAPLVSPVAANALSEGLPDSGGVETADPEGTRAVAAFEAPLDVRIPILNVPGDPASGERDPATVAPWDLALSPDGRFAYVDNAEYGQPFTELWVFDLEQRLHVKTLEVGNNPGGASILRVATSANVLATRGGDTVFVVDTLTNEIRDRWDIPASSGYREAISPDGQFFFMVASNGLVSRLNLATGVVEASRKVPVTQVGQVQVTPDGERLAIGDGNRETATYRLLSTATLEDIGPIHPTPAIKQFSRIEFDPAGAALYQTDTGARINKLDPTTGQMLKEVLVGELMSGVVPNPAQNRAWGTSVRFSLAMVADYNTGLRSESFRALPGGSVDLARRPNGELVAPNGAKGKRGPDASISVLLTPAITQQPANVEVTEVDEVAVFTAELQGVKHDAASGVTWQRSDDAGETWTDLDAHGLSLEVPANRETVAAEYRLSYSDDFWGESGASEPARIVAPLPEILDPVTELAATAGTAMTPTVFTARAQAAHEWDAEGLPEGVTIDAQTGELSGTPTAAGAFSATVSVSDGFGEDTVELAVTVTDAAGNPGTDPGTDPGVDPGTEPGADPGTDPGTGPGAGPGDKPGDKPGAGGQLSGEQPGGGASDAPSWVAGLADTGGTGLIWAGALGAGLLLAGLFVAARRSRA